jgi:phosphate/sulfate permease
MEATLALPLLIGLIGVALLFDFLNGLHDAANSIATIVSTRVLRPHYAVFWAAFFNFIAFLFFGLHVAQTIGTGIIDASVVDARVVLGALLGAIAWNVITWAFGIPSSSSHALIGGLVGAGMAKNGIGAIVWGGLGKTGAAIFVSPLIGFILALLLMLIVSSILVRQCVPDAAIPLSLALLPGPRRQRRPKDHGDHRCSAAFSGASRQRVSRSFLGGDRLSARFGARNAVRRLADCPHHGFEDHATDAVAGVLR